MELLLNIFDYALLIGIILSLIAFLPKITWYVIGVFGSGKDNTPKAKENHKFAVIIPARNESNAIRSSLDSLKNQTFPREFFDIYIAVEDINDPTCEIAKEYDAEIYVKQDFTKNGKGFVLEEVVQHIFTNREDRKYEAIMIVDADNEMNDDYLELMNDAYDAGYDICLGKRDTKNWNDGWLAVNTGLNFVRFSRFQNYGRSKYDVTVLLSGTCYYIKYDIVKERGGWSWHSLTEDVELTTESALYNYKTHYMHNAVFYDEQPTDIKTSFHQRKRWVRGFFDVGHKHNKAIYKGISQGNTNKVGCLELAIGAFPMVIFALTVLPYLIGTFTIGMLSYNNIHFYEAYLLRTLLTAFAYIFVMYIDSIILLTKERKNINIKWYKLLTAILLRPMYSLLYLPIAMSAVGKNKKVEWVPIKHKG